MGLQSPPPRLQGWTHGRSRGIPGVGARGLRMRCRGPGSEAVVVSRGSSLAWLGLPAPGLGAQPWVPARHRQALTLPPALATHCHSNPVLRRGPGGTKMWPKVTPTASVHPLETPPGTRMRQGPAHPSPDQTDSSVPLPPPVQISQTWGSWKQPPARPALLTHPHTSPCKKRPGAPAQPSRLAGTYQPSPGA